VAKNQDVPSDLPQDLLRQMFNLAVEGKRLMGPHAPNFNMLKPPAPR
jgi:hypothetical protein